MPRRGVWVVGRATLMPGPSRGPRGRSGAGRVGCEGRAGGGAGAGQGIMVAAERGKRSVVQAGSSSGRGRRQPVGSSSTLSAGLSKWLCVKSACFFSSPLLRTRVPAGVGRSQPAARPRHDASDRRRSWLRANHSPAREQGGMPQPPAARSHPGTHGLALSRRGVRGPHGPHLAHHAGHLWRPRSPGWGQSGISAEDAPAVQHPAASRTHLYTPGGGHGGSQSAAHPQGRNAWGGGSGGGVHPQARKAGRRGGDRTATARPPARTPPPG